MPTVIVENDVSQWDDQTGEVYHFPKRYRDLLLPGERVIYYKGRMKDKRFEGSRLSRSPHYFGIAEVGDVFPIKNGKELLAKIINFRPFEVAIDFQQDGEYLEKIPKSKETNYWRDGVRRIDEDTYNEILSLAIVGPVSETKTVLSDSDNQSFESGVEGRSSAYTGTRYERDQELRKRALLIHGCTCAACGFNFEEFYGEYAKGFIHIHHVEPLFETGEKIVNPETDLIPLCANCHAVVHRKRDKTLTVEDLQAMINRDMVESA